ncbi:hypothetical protein AcW1_000284 [Taiwanofungus camphoratus]|nr:hypothetical protein AcV7_000303 [Antrodia cinnamomea]KAI0963110.1 hypothetical protein AcW1_000284 [Antrodia cinnamomea]
MNVVTERISRKFIGAVEDEWQLFSNDSSDYTVGVPIGFGASSTVYTAQYQPPDAPQPLPCALKVLDLDRLPPHSLRLLQRETQLMSLSKHPNVLRVRGTWMNGCKLYIAMRLMNAGSAADLMRYGWPGGLEEEVIRCILKQALEGLNYLHINGLIHRDVKAANLLIDDDGTVLLGDLGVAAFLWDVEDTPPAPSFPTVQIHKRTNTPTCNPHSHNHHLAHTHPHSPLHVHPHHPHHPHAHSHPHPHPHPHPYEHPHPHPHKPRTIGKRKSFVGTPAYMAPEVINGRTYDASADIWSFGITALELTQGRAPRSLVSPQTALLQTVRDAPPRLDRSAGVHRYSRALQDVVASCLEKDPAKRPSAAELLQTPLFRGARKKNFLVGAVLSGLPPLTQRQERRRQPSVMTHGTMDSWDFPGSMQASPTTSVYSHHLHPLGVLPAVDGDADGESEDGSGDGGEGREEQSGSSAEAYALRIRGRHGSSHHGSCPVSCSNSRSLSWVEGDDAPASGLGHGYPEHAHPVPIAEVDLSALPDSSSQSDSDSEREPPPEMKATLAVPAVNVLSTSPSASSYSSATSSTSVSALEPVTPPSPPRAAPQPQNKLWRKLTTRFDGDKDKEKSKRAESEKWKEKEQEKARAGVVKEKSNEAGPKPGSVRKKTLSVLGRRPSWTLPPAGDGGSGGVKLIR